MPKIITIGEILVEIMAAQRGQTFLQPGTFYGPFPSGAPAIFIDQAARMGVPCGIISRVGKDPFGELNLNRLKKDGVDVSHVTVDPNRLTGIAFVTYHPDGGREFIYHFKDSTIGSFTPDEIDEAYLSSAEYLHIMGCSLLASAQIARVISKGVDLAVKHGLKVSFDPNIRPELLKEKETELIFERILHQADIVLTGAGEIRQITYCGDTETAVKKLLSDTRIVAVKNGDKDTVVYSGEERFSVTPFSVEEVDPTGAGDCFDGAFIAALAQGCDLEQAAKMGCAAGALAVRKQGPMEGASFKPEIEAMLLNQ